MSPIDLDLDLVADVVMVTRVLVDPDGPERSVRLGSAQGRP